MSFLSTKMLPTVICNFVVCSGGGVPTKIKWNKCDKHAHEIYQQQHTQTYVTLHTHTHTHTDITSYSNLLIKTLWSEVNIIHHHFSDYTHVKHLTCLREKRSKHTPSYNIPSIKTTEHMRQRREQVSSQQRRHFSALFCFVFKRQKCVFYRPSRFPPVSR